MTTQNVSGAGKSKSEARKTSALCWAARIVPLVVAIPLVPWTLYLFWLHTTTYVNDPAPLPMLTVFLVPMVFALIAWKWHLAGGALLTAFALLAIAVPIILTGYDVVLMTVGAVMLAGGIIHLLVWWREDWRVKPRQIKPASGPVTPVI